MFVTRNRFLSTLGAARRLTVSADHVHVASMGVRRPCSPVYRGNACWRLLDHDVRMIHSVTQPWITTEDESREMMALWPEIFRDLVHGAKTYRTSNLLEIRNIHKLMERILQYIVPDEKKTRGLTVPYVYRLLTSNDQLTEDNIRLTRILEFCVETLQAYSLLLQDIQDGSIRDGLFGFRDLPHRDDDLFIVITDHIDHTSMLNNTIKYIIRKHFEDKELCFDLLKTFQDTLEEAVREQWEDLYFTNYGKKLHPNVFTTQYHSIVGYKTSHYSFFLPVTVAMHFAGINNVDKLRQAEAILSNVGFLFNVQDDYMACFEESKVIGKDNTDIQKGKCTWLVATAFDYATPVQRNILKECYGSSDPEKVKRVKQLFIDLELPDRYSIFEDEMYNLQNVLLQKLSPGPLHKFFSDLLGKLYRRSV